METITILKKLLFTIIIGFLGTVVVIIDEITYNIFNINKYGWTFFNIISHIFLVTFIIVSMYFLILYFLALLKEM